jgi:hypothetical protein
MYHKTIRLRLDGLHSVRVKLHSINGHEWSSSSPRQAAREQLRYLRRRKAEYITCAHMFLDVPAGGIDYDTK